MIRSALDTPTVEALALACDCKDEGLKVEPTVRDELEQKIIEGLESYDIQTVAFTSRVILRRRLNNFLRLDDVVEMDIGYVTCAEYQLFLDDSSQAKGEERRPAHWVTDRFPKGHAQQPVTGVRLKDAKDFCRWLTRWDDKLTSLYRLPTIPEFRRNALTDSAIGGWCQAENESKLLGINEEEAINWCQILAQTLKLECGEANDIVQTLSSQLTHDDDKSNELWETLAARRFVKIPFENDRIQELVEYLSTVFVNSNSLSEIADKLSRSAENLAEEVQKTSLLPDLTINLVLHIQTELLKTNELLDVRIYVLIVSAIWELMAEKYIDVAENRDFLNEHRLRQQDCRKLSQSYMENGNEIFKYYIFLMATCERQNNSLVAWESIRVVRQTL